MVLAIPALGLGRGTGLTVNLFPTHGIGMLEREGRDVEFEFDSCERYAP